MKIAVWRDEKKQPQSIRGQESRWPQVELKFPALCLSQPSALDYYVLSLVQAKQNFFYIYKNNGDKLKKEGH